MPITLTEVEQQARTLSTDDRARLVEVLIESLHEPPLVEIEGLWEAEIAARVAAYESGEAQTVTAEEVFAEARRLAR